MMVGQFGDSYTFDSQQLGPSYPLYERIWDRYSRIWADLLTGTGLLSKNDDLGTSALKVYGAALSPLLIGGYFLLKKKGRR